MFWTESNNKYEKVPLSGGITIKTSTILSFINPLMPGGSKKVTYT